MQRARSARIASIEKQKAATEAAKAAAAAAAPDPIVTKRGQSKKKSTKPTAPKHRVTKPAVAKKKATKPALSNEKPTKRAATKVMDTDAPNPQRGRAKKNPVTMGDSLESNPSAENHPPPPINPTNTSVDDQTLPPINHTNASVENQPPPTNTASASIEEQTSPLINTTTASVEEQPPASINPINTGVEVKSPLPATNPTNTSVEGHLPPTNPTIASVEEHPLHPNNPTDTTNEDQPPRPTTPDNQIPVVQSAYSGNWRCPSVVDEWSDLSVTPPPPATLSDPPSVPPGSKKRKASAADDAPDASPSATASKRARTEPHTTTTNPFVTNSSADAFWASAQQINPEEHARLMADLERFQTSELFTPFVSGMLGGAIRTVLAGPGATVAAQGQGMVEGLLPLVQSQWEQGVARLRGEMEQGVSDREEEWGGILGPVGVGEDAEMGHETASERMERERVRAARGDRSSTEVMEED